MAVIKKRGKTWGYSISRTVNGEQKQYRKGGYKSKNEAKVAGAEKELELSKGIFTPLKAVPLSDYFVNWVELYKSNLSGSTIYNYKYTSKAITEYFGSTDFKK
jgi:hypothetical protein